MIGEGIHEEVLRTLVEQHAVRECLVARIAGGPVRGLLIRLAGGGARWVPVRSRREVLRTWASLTADGRWPMAVLPKPTDLRASVSKSDRRKVQGQLQNPSTSGASSLSDIF